MARSLLVVPAAEDVGLARTCLGLLRALDREGVHVAYVKPVAQPRADGSPDRSVALVSAITTLCPPEPLSTAELERQHRSLDVATRQRRDRRIGGAGLDLVAVDLLFGVAAKGGAVEPPAALGKGRAVEFAEGDIVSHAHAADAGVFQRLFRQ